MLPLVVLLVGHAVSDEALSLGDLLDLPHERPSPEGRCVGDGLSIPAAHRRKTMGDLLSRVGGPEPGETVGDLERVPTMICAGPPSMVSPLINRTASSWTGACLSMPAAPEHSGITRMGYSCRLGKFSRRNPHVRDLRSACTASCRPASARAHHGLRCHVKCQHRYGKPFSVRVWKRRGTTY